MKRFSSIRLKLWLPILILVTFILMLIASSIWHYQLQISQLEERSSVALKNRMANMQHRIESLLRLQEEGLVSEEIAEMGALPEVTHIALADNNGKILNASNKPWLNKVAKDTVPDFEQSLFDIALMERRLILKLDAQRDQLFAYQPITLATQAGKIRPTQVGVLLLNYSLATAKAEIKNNTVRISTVDLFIILLTIFLLIAVLHLWLSVPLAYLGEAASRISQGDFKTHIEFTGKGELAELGAAFNRMQNDLQNSISQLQKYTLELLASEENLSVTLDSIGDAVITTDASGNVKRMNPVAEQLTGWSSDAAHSQPLDHVFHIINSRTRNVAPNPVHQVFKSGNIVGLANHTSLLAKDGREYHIADSAAPIRNKSGQIDGVILVFHDVSEQYRKQALIAAHEAELRKITNILPGPVSHVDRDGRYLFVSSAYENWFGKRPQDVMGLTQFEAIGAELYASFEPYFKRALAGEKLTFELTLPSPAGGSRDVLVNVIPDFDSEGDVCGYFTIVTDITERKLAEHTALRLREQLAQASKMESVGHLTAGIAHDFNNILGAILGYTELSQLATANSKPDTVELYLAEIVKASLRAKELIAQMLTFSRQTPDMQSDPAPVTLLSHVIKEVVSLLRSSIPASIDIHYLVDDANLTGQIQAVNLHQILLNLGINARDAIGEYGKIDIHLSSKTGIRRICSSCKNHFDGDFVKLSVRDTGCGIPAHILNKIFDPFFTTKGVGKGTGMGLSVVHGLVHACGGHIKVESEVGRSTTISILLPLLKSGAVKQEEPAAPTALTYRPDSLSGLRIMVVDDELSMAAMLHEFLIIHGARPVSFMSGLAALHAFESAPESIDMVITDETMPGLSGMHMAVRILKLKPGLPVILCTGFSEKATAALAAEAGLAGFFYKPLQLHELLQKIQSIWRGKINQKTRT